MSVKVEVEPEEAAKQAVEQLNDITGWPEGMKLVRTKGSGKRPGFAIQHGASVLVTADRMVQLLPWLTQLHGRGRSDVGGPTTPRTEPRSAIGSISAAADR